MLAVFFRVLWLGFRIFTTFFRVLGRLGLGFRIFTVSHVFIVFFEFMSRVSDFHSFFRVLCLGFRIFTVFSEFYV